MSQELDRIKQELLNQECAVKTGGGQIDYILVDGSGSMMSRWQEAMKATDEYVMKLRDVPTTVTVATFSSGGGFDYRVLRESHPESWQHVSEDGSVTCPGGGTPLYDAINTMARVLHEKMPDKASILIITDGDENASKTTVDQAKAILDYCRRRGWQVTFLGCDFENSRQARLLGATSESQMGIDARRLTDATSALAEKRKHYDQFGAPMGFSDDEKKKFGGYLPPANGK
jgi:Mg-chelatase subunit ChlD